MKRIGLVNLALSLAVVHVCWAWKAFEFASLNDLSEFQSTNAAITSVGLNLSNTAGQLAGVQTAAEFKVLRMFQLQSGL